MYSLATQKNLESVSLPSPFHPRNAILEIPSLFIATSERMVKVDLIRVKCVASWTLLELLLNCSCETALRNNNRNKRRHTLKKIQWKKDTMYLYCMLLLTVFSMMYCTRLIQHAVCLFVGIHFRFSFFSADTKDRRRRLWYVSV